ncbi:MAG: CRTAC1 family protein [Verrucomicrobiales bacterium]|nr:CRTAC1 family protein [Verrucomicrobiales bacterium]
MREPSVTARPWARTRLGIIGILGVGLILAAFAWKRQRQLAQRTHPELASIVPPEVLKRFVDIEKSSLEADATVWASEILAQRYGASVERLWEELLRANDALARLQSVPINTLSMASVTETTPLPHGIHRWVTDSSSTLHTVTDWKERLGAWHAQGWRLEQSEWRHVEFVPRTTGTAAYSRFEVRLNFSRSAPVARAQASARLRIEWPATPSQPPAAFFGAVAIERLDLLERAQPPVFQLAGVAEVEPFEKTTWIDPVLLRRPTPGSLPEIVLAARNLVLRRNSQGAWSDATLSSHHPGLIFTSILADFDGDGLDDLLMAVRSGLVLLRGGADGSYETAAVPVWTAPERLQYVQALSTGDMDGDGDLDVFLGQYRTPYEGGQMPRPYFDALDGPPAFLLRNRGNGQFDDATAGSGLEPKRHRRSYGASMVDLDRDADLDLVVVNDFAGLDVFANDGKGGFTDTSHSWFDNTRGFGMAHAHADFDADGVADLLLVGMPQATADRLNALGLERSGHETWREQRPHMVFGNRLFFGSREGFRQRPVGERIARAGWAWSAAILDLDNDRYADAYFVNGHETRQSVRDYETEFWTHDIYIGDSTPRPEVNAYFASKFARTRAAGWSYGGHQLNAFFLNQGGTNFVDIGHLFGLALPEDCRNTVAADWDGDGDQDLVVTTFEVWPRLRQTVRFLENTGIDGGRWAGVRLKAVAGGIPIAGAEITVEDEIGLQRRPWTIGDGYRAQALPELHFGLGRSRAIRSIEVRWADGRTNRIEQGAVDRTYEFTAPLR